ncbi:isoaspartyl peptidase/L-asparaginase [Thorsellia kenyensis]|uniref:Isoaspartyl peptidase/L-asparaginase n=1 Tax=Thorsellia kenyensis TaxID=1549888 RepID=A0ABV6C9P5_9GAMM
MAFFLITGEGKNALDEGISSLNANKSHLDTIETMIKIVELDEEVTSVGIHSWPNMLGEMEFDAAIIDGTTKEAGVIGALKQALHPISVARKVMEVLPHVVLVGEGARHFADEQGFGRHIALTPNSLIAYNKWLKDHNLVDVPSLNFSELAWKTADPQKAGGTVVALVQDNTTHMAGGVSTSGWAWKHPGRLGDSPILGAGMYADSRYGAAGCIGHGEYAIRTVAAKSIVQYMECGLSSKEAVLKVAEEILRLPKRMKAAIGLHAVSNSGEPFLAAIGGFTEPYFFWRSGMSKAEKREADIVISMD